MLAITHINATFMTISCLFGAFINLINADSLKVKNYCPHYCKATIDIFVYISKIIIGSVKIVIAKSIGIPLIIINLKFFSDFNES